MTADLAEKKRDNLSSGKRPLLFIIFPYTVDINKYRSHKYTSIHPLSAAMHDLPEREGFFGKKITICRISQKKMTENVFSFEDYTYYYRKDDFKRT